MGCPALDDVVSMPALKSEARRQHLLNPVLEQIADMLISTLFYFKITQRPIRYSTHVAFRGCIMCDIPPGKELEWFMNALKATNSEFCINGRTYLLPPARKWNPQEREFELPVYATAASFSTPFNTYLCQSRPKGRAKHDISLSPFSLETIMKMQNWDLPRKPPASAGKKRKDRAHPIQPSAHVKRTKYMSQS